MYMFSVVFYHLLFTFSSEHMYKCTNPWPLQHNDSNTGTAVELLPFESDHEQLPKDPPDMQKIHAKQNQASLPHFYESLRGGQQQWLSSPKSSCLDTLEEERGAAANCNDSALNSVGQNHPYAVLEAKASSFRYLEGHCTADSLPSLLGPSSLDHGGSMAESAVSSDGAVLNFETNPLPLPPKLETVSSSKSRRKKKAKCSPAYPEDVSVTSQQGQAEYDKLKPKPAASKPKPPPANETLDEAESDGSTLESSIPLSLNLVSSDSKDD